MSQDEPHSSVPARTVTTTPHAVSNVSQPSAAGLAAALTVCMGVGPLSLYALSALSPFVVSDLRLSGTQYGAVATVAFAVAAVSSLTFGRVADVISGRRLMYLISAGAGLALLLVAGAPNYMWLLFAVVLSGAAQSISNPVTNQLISSHVPEGQGLVMGVKQSGVQVSQFIAGLMFPALALLVGWRWAMASGVFLALLGVLFARAYVPVSVMARRRASDSRHASRRLPAAVWWLTGYAFLVGFGLQATNVYLPLFAHEQVGLTAGVAGLTAAVAGFVGLVSRIAWGRFAERMSDPGVTLAVLGTLAVIGVILVFLSGWLHWPLLLWPGTALFGASALASNAVVMLALIRNVPVDSVGAASGVLATGLYVGFAGGPISFGLVADASGAYLWTWLVPLVSFTLALTAALGWRMTSQYKTRPKFV